MVGKALTPEGEQDIKAFLRVRRDEREVMMAHLADGTFCFETKSWLLANDRREVTHQFRFSEKTLVLLMEVMFLGSEYFGVDLMAQVRALADNADKIDFEYAGNGEPNFSQEAK